MSKHITTVIFDLDGVIGDTQHLHAEAEHEVLKHRGIHLHPDDITHRFSGVSGQEMFRDIFDQHNHDGDVDEIIAEKRAIMAQHHNTITPIPGVRELVERLKQDKFRLGVASASGPVFIHKVLRVAGIESHFDSVTSAREVANGKPAPDIFLRAAEKLRAQPEDCVVIEDAIHGMTGAKAAGMFCIGFVRPHLRRDGITYPADHIVEHMHDLSPDIIRFIKTA